MWIKTLALAAAYFVTAKVGLMVNPVSGFATLIWAPSGIGLTALIFWGPRVWPGIALGAFFVNLTVGAPVPVALGIAVGNTLEPFVGATLLRLAGFSPGFEELKSVVTFVVCGPLLSTLISATVGVSSLYFGGKLSTTFGTAWIAWWSGDAMGDLLLAPLLLAWGSSKRAPRRSRELIEEVFLLSVIALVSAFLYSDWLVPGTPRFLRPYLAFPLLTFIAVRHDVLATVSAVFLVSAISLGTVLSGHGRFYNGSLGETLLETEIFLAILTVTKLVLAAVISERRAQKQELLTAEAQLKRAVRARDDFMSIASHELKTPLTSLLLQVQIRQRASEKGTPPPEKLLKQASDDLKQVNRLVKLVDDILDVSRINSEKLRLTTEQFDLGEMVREVLNRFEPLLERANMETTLDARSGVLGQWDRNRMEQVLGNLLTNAIKYGEGKPLHISVSSSGDHARLLVRDQGMGIAETDRERVFELFERATGDSNISGLGLGLYIARQLVEAHEGVIRVESELGKGSSFVVDLPTVASGRNAR